MEVDLLKRGDIPTEPEGEPAESGDGEAAGETTSAESVSAQVDAPEKGNGGGAAKRT